MPLPVHFRKCTLLRVLWIFAPRAEKSLSQVRQLHPSRSDLQLLLEDFEACPSRAAACLTFSELTKNKQADFHAAQASSKNDPFATPKHQHISRRNGRPSGGSGMPNVAFGPEEKQAEADFRAAQASSKKGSKAESLLRFSPKAVLSPPTCAPRTSSPLLSQTRSLPSHGSCGWYLGERPCCYVVGRLG